jgi:hypothetical protein
MPAVDDDELLPLPQAARMLGTRPENLRKRLQRGLTLRGVKRGGAWYVSRNDVEREIRAMGPPGAASAVERELALTRELLEAERRRADRLDALLDEERQASAELRRLLARALGEPD